MYFKKWIMDPEPSASCSTEADCESAVNLVKRTIRRFTFTTKNPDDDDDDEEEEEQLTVYISEVLHPDYGMYTWPCAPVLAQYVYYHRHKFNGKKVLELAAGTALPGIVAAKCGAKVTLTDAVHYPQCRENCRRSIEANGLTEAQVDVSSLTWGTIEPNILELKGFDYVLASDCFYDPKDFQGILMTISFILERNSGCKCLCTYQVRSSNWNVENLLDAWGLQCKHIFRSTFNADVTDLAGSNLPGRHSIQMLKFTRLMK